MVDDTRVSGHPGVDLTLDLDHDLGFGEGFLELHSFDGHAKVELGTVLRERVDIMKSVVAVPDLESLVGLDPENLGAILAPFLIEYDRSFGSFERLAFKTFFYVNKYIL